MVYVVGLAIVIIVGYAVYRSKKIKITNETADFKDAAAFADTCECDKTHADDEDVKIELAIEPKVSAPKKKLVKVVAKKKAKKIVDEILPEVTVSAPKKKAAKKPKNKKIVG